MTTRAIWKGFLKVEEVVCPVALYTAASTSDRITLHTINRATGNRIHREFVDSETGKPVDRDDQVKGYELAKGEHVILEPEEVAAAVPGSDKTLTVSAFIRCGDIDALYFDKPYYLAPSDKAAEDAFVVLRDGLRKRNAAALAQTVLFRRVRSLLIRPDEDGLIATTLNFDYEVRSAKDAFDGLRSIKIDGEMLDLAKHIIATKKGSFDPKGFDDRYEAALAELVKAKMEGRALPKPKEPERGNVVNLMDALRESAGRGKSKKTAAKKAPAKKKGKAAAPKRKRKAA